MSQSDTVDISTIRFTSMAQPTDEDVALWESLSPEIQRAVILRDLEEARQSGIAPHETKEEVLARVRSEKTR